MIVALYFAFATTGGLLWETTHQIIHHRADIAARLIAIAAVVGHRVYRRFHDTGRHTAAALAGAAAPVRPALAAAPTAGDTHA